MGCCNAQRISAPGHSTAVIAAQKCPWLNLGKQTECCAGYAVTLRRGVYGVLRGLLAAARPMVAGA
jgi:hypothetical protein